MHSTWCTRHALVLLLAALPTPAQNYRCDWSVVDQGGVRMASSSFQAMPSLGQTATGLIAGSHYQAFIGFWQIDTASTAIRTEEERSPAAPVRTQLYRPSPNPGRGPIYVHYALAARSRVRLAVLDLLGREVAELVNSGQSSGLHYVLWNPVAQGIYFVRLSAEDTRATQKLVVR